MLPKCVVTKIYSCDAKCWDFCLLFLYENRLSSAILNLATWRLLVYSVQCVVRFARQEMPMLNTLEKFILIVADSRCMKKILSKEKMYRDLICLSVSMSTCDSFSAIDECRQAVLVCSFCLSICHSLPVINRCKQAVLVCSVCVSYLSLFPSNK